MPAYIVIRIGVDDPGILKEYQAATAPIVEKCRGRFLARGGSVVTLEGPEESRRIVIIEFPELADAEAFYHSPEFAQARRLRVGRGVAEVIAVDGIKQWEPLTSASTQTWPIIGRQHDIQALGRRSGFARRMGALDG